MDSLSFPVREFPATSVRIALTCKFSPSEKSFTDSTCSSSADSIMVELISPPVIVYTDPCSEKSFMPIAPNNWIVPPFNVASSATGMLTFNSEFPPFQ